MPRSRLTLWLFCGWLVLLPLPFGAARTWALALVLPPLFLLAAWVSATRRDPADGLLAFLLRPPGLMLAAFMAVVAAQLLALGGAPDSVVPYRTQLYLLLAFACTVTVWLALALVRTTDDLRTLMLALVAGALLQACIASLMIATGAGLSFMDSEIRPGRVATGTFVNRNHLAGYLNIGLAAGIGLLAGHLARPRESRSWAIRVRDALLLLLGGKARLRLVLILLVIVLIATRSRMGNAAFFAALVVATCVYAVFERERRRGLLIFAASVVVIDLVLIGTWVGVDRVVDRIQNTPLMARMAGDDPAAAPAAAAGQAEAGLAGLTGLGAVPGGAAPAEGAATAPAEPPGPPPRRDPRTEQSVQDRIEPALDAVRIVREHPWIGTGGGSFYLVYMAYQPNYEGFYNHAHNDYLEIAADTGLLGLGALLALALASLVQALSVLRHRRHPVLRSAAFATVMSVTAMALHALVDFNLHIPANLLSFCVIIALPFTARRLHSRRGAHEAAAREDGTSAARAAAGMAAGRLGAARAAGPLPPLPEPTR